MDVVQWPHCFRSSVGDCVLCDTTASCVPDVEGTACSCNIRVLHGRTICREMGICGDSSNCDGDPPPAVSTVKAISIDGSAIEQLFRKEPLLALVLSGSIVADAKGRMSQLDTDDYNGGTFRTESGEVFHHRGSFTPHESGEVTFRFTLEGVTLKDKVVYVGTLSKNGNHIRFGKIQTDETGKVSRSSEDLDLGLVRNQ